MINPHTIERRLAGITDKALSKTEYFILLFLVTVGIATVGTQVNKRWGCFRVPTVGLTGLVGGQITDLGLPGDSRLHLGPSAWQETDRGKITSRTGEVKSGKNRIGFGVVTHPGTFLEETTICLE